MILRPILGLFCSIYLTWVPLSLWVPFSPFSKSGFFSLSLALWVSSNNFFSSVPPADAESTSPPRCWPPSSVQPSLSAGHATDDSGTPHHAPHARPASLHAAPWHDPASRTRTRPDPTRGHATTAAYAGPDATCPACKCLVVGSHINRMPESKGTGGGAVLGWVSWADLLEEVRG